MLIVEQPVRFADVLGLSTVTGAKIVKTAFETSVIAVTVVFVILTKACVFVSIWGIVQGYEPLFVVDAIIVFHVEPLFNEYSIFTGDAKTLLFQVML